MAKNFFYETFLDLLRGCVDMENQIVSALPKVIQNVTNRELKTTLQQHLEETKGQVQRLKQIFKELNENPTGKKCAGMEGILKEGEEQINKAEPSAVKDATLIIACQKVEHYEIACYGSARSIARHLSNLDLNKRVDFDEIADLLQQSLDEEITADEKLTDIAEGGFFTQGINDLAEKEQVSVASNSKKKK